MATISLGQDNPAPAKGVIEQIVGFARGNGIDQSELAARAGISAESLSRLKKDGGCRLATALELARAAGFGAFDLTTRPGTGTAALLAARKLSAGRRLPIGEDGLLRALRRGHVPEDRAAHLTGFFEELPIELVHDVILDANLDYGSLVTLARNLGAEGETVDWLAEMAGDGLADAT